MSQKRIHEQLNGMPVESTVHACGVEFYTIHGQEYEQCARCGSSVYDMRDEDPVAWKYPDCYRCCSPAEWCNANPIPGREEQKGAGRTKPDALKGEDKP